MHTFMFIQCFKSIQYLREELYCLFLTQSLLLFKILRQITIVTVLENEVEIICCLFDVV
jgi:hypothetical protein